MKNSALLVNVILGGIIVMLLYHMALYFFQREKLLFNYNLYLFFTFLLLFIFSDVFYFSFGDYYANYFHLRLKEACQILYLTFYYKFILSSLEIRKKSTTNKIWRFFYFSLISYAIIFMVYMFLFGDEKTDKTIPFITSRLSMFIISLALLKRCYELRNFTFQKYILYGASVYFLFGLFAFYSSMIGVSFLGIGDIEWLFVGAMIDIIFFGLAISHRNRIKMEESIKNKLLFEQEQRNNLQLSEMNNTLKTLNTELIVSEENLQKSNNSKEQLISMMSHDLLNPITAITNYNQQIIARKNNTDELLQAFKTVDMAIQPMQSLLGNVLQWTAIQKDGVVSKLKEQDINDIVKEIIGLYRPQAQLKFIKLLDSFDTHFVLETDKSILSLILRNLLSNAIKYSGNETIIEILSDSKTKTISIKDQGFGMTDEMIGYLNNKKLNKIEAKGTGLGLKLCYEFAESIGASIIFTKNDTNGIRVDLKL